TVRRRAAINRPGAALGGERTPPRRLHHRLRLPLRHLKAQPGLTTGPGKNDHAPCHDPPPGHWATGPDGPSADERTYCRRQGSPALGLTRPASVPDRTDNRCPAPRERPRRRGAPDATPL